MTSTELTLRVLGHPPIPSGRAFSFLPDPRAFSFAAPHLSTGRLRLARRRGTARTSVFATSLPHPTIGAALSWAETGRCSASTSASTGANAVAGASTGAGQVLRILVF